MLFIVVLVVVIVPLALLLAFVPRTWLEQDGVTGFLNTASTLVPLALLVFGILGMTGEYRHGTITYSYLVTPRRWQVMVMKLAVYAAVGMVLMLLAVGLVYATIGIGGVIRGVEIDASGGATAGDYARQIVVAGLITAFGVALGALVRLQAVTVAVTLIWALIAEPLVAALKPTVGNWLPFQVFNQVTMSNVSQQGPRRWPRCPDSTDRRRFWSAWATSPWWRWRRSSSRCAATSRERDGRAGAPRRRGRCAGRARRPSASSAPCRPGSASRAPCSDYAAAAEELPTFVVRTPAPGEARPAKRSRVRTLRSSAS